jgi:iron complex outermembrane recepter protein
MRQGSRTLGWVGACLLLLAFAIPIRAESEVAAGEITGAVKGPDGSGLPGVTISIRNIETGDAVRVVTGDQGIYRVLNLKPGSYELKAEIPGFESTLIEGITVAPTGSLTIDVRMKPATLHESVTVMGRMPKASLESAPVRESTARDVGEAMAEVSGIAKVRKGGIASDVILDGFQSKDLNVLIDGDRIYGACPNSMDPAAFHVDFAEVERVEVGKGPFDMLNQGSLGGVLNIVTRLPERGFHSYGSLAGGSRGYINPAMTASYGSEKYSALAGFSFRRSDPYTDGSGKRFSEYGNFRPGAVDSDAFRVGTAWAKISARPRSNHQALLTFTRQQADHVLYPYLLMDAIYDNGDRFSLSYKIDISSGPVKSVRFQSYYTDVSHWMTDKYRTSSLNLSRDYSMGTMARTETFGGKVETTLLTAVVGVEMFRRQWDTTTRMAGSGYSDQFSIPDVKADTLGLYADYRLSLSERLNLSLGARFDATRSAADPSKANTNLYFAYNSTRRTSVTDTYPSGSIRLSYQLSPDLEIDAGLGHTVRVPDARERYFALRRMGSDWVGNPDLKPSRNTGANVGLSFRGQGLSVESSLYWNQIEDFVIVAGKKKVNPVMGVMNTNARSYQNADARIYGLDTDVSYSIAPRVFISGGLSVLRGTKTPRPEMGILSRNLPEMPPLRGRLSLRYEDGTWMGEAEGVFAGAQERIDADLQEAATAGYGILNLKAGFNLGRYALRVGLDNVLDLNYFEYLSFQRDPFRSGVRVMEPGRNLYVSLSYRY